MSNSVTDYGFRWGPMEVNRLVYVEGRGYVIEVKTDHALMQIYISEKGRKMKPYQVRYTKKVKA